MERLMVKLEDGNYIPRQLCSINRFGEVDDYDSCAEYCELQDSDCNKCAINQCFNRLAEYDNLDNQCIKENSCDLRMLLQKWKEFMDDIHNLYEYRDLERQGKLLKLPCAVGDKVWIIHTYSGGGRIPNWREIYEGVFSPNMVSDGDFGKTIFLTKSEAELALQKINETEDSV